MKPEPNRNLPASVRQRLLTLCQRLKEPFDFVFVGMPSAKLWRI